MNEKTTKNMPKNAIQFMLDSYRTPADMIQSLDGKVRKEREWRRAGTAPALAGILPANRPVPAAIPYNWTRS